MAKGNTKSGARKPASAQAGAEKRSIAREVIGVILIGVAAVMIYAMFAGVRAGGFLYEINRFVAGIAGKLGFVMPLLLIYLGILVIFSGRSKKLSPGRVALILLLFVSMFTGVELFFCGWIAQSMHVPGYANALVRAYQAGTGGGLFGALLAWPLYRTLTEWGGLIVVLIVAVADLVLMRKISLAAIGERARTRIDDFRDKRKDLREIERVERADAAKAEREKIHQRRVALEEEHAKTERENSRIERTDAPRRTRAIDDARRSLYVEPVTESGSPETGDSPEVPDFMGKKSRPARKAERPRRAVPEQEREQVIPRVDLSAEDAAFDLPSAPKRAADRETAAAAKGETTGLSGRPFASAPSEPVAAMTAAEADFSVGEAVDVPEDARSIPGELPQAEPEPLPDGHDGTPENNPHMQQPMPSFQRKDAPFTAAAARAGTSAAAESAGAATRVVHSSPLTDPEGEEEHYNYPPIDLMKASGGVKQTNDKEVDMQRAQTLVSTLKSFGIEVRLTGVAHGPAVTRFELAPAPGIKVSRIAALADDIALNLAAVSVRIEAPIPGKAAVGVEVPNESIETVPLRDVLESNEARRHPSRLAVGLGKDNAGRYIVADLAKMPHVLIAGQTGSGKSVCINCIITSILYRATPDEVRLIMIDPKVVELSTYNGIPHLLVPVVTDPKKAASALDWAVNEMTQRYKKFAEQGVRDMKGYNAKCPEGEKPMPQIVIIIDELADLMMVTPGEVEDSICRLAQLARAAGIHLVIATQRPSVNVITGVIKANIPSRIAFTVASQVDSRTILDSGGAEKLLGRGDMLYFPSGISKPLRVQGAWVSDEEVTAVVDYIKERHDTDYNEDVIEHMNNQSMSDAEKEEAQEEYDDLLPQAVEIVVDAGQASISMLQRRLRVGYARAGRLIDEMAARKIVSQSEGAKPRDVLITKEQFQLMFGDN